jgi:hypothetical protein
VIILSLACKKQFPDGPLISFRSKAKRIEGTWKLDKFYINSVDSTIEYNTMLGCEIEFILIDIIQGNAEGNVILKNCNNGKDYYGIWQYRTWGFCTTFKKDTTFTNGIGPFGSERSVGPWTVLRLTNKEFNLKTYDPGYGLWGSHPNGTPYVINLKKQ